VPFGIVVLLPVESHQVRVALAADEVARPNFAVQQTGEAHQIFVVQLAIRLPQRVVADCAESPLNARALVNGGHLK